MPKVKKPRASKVTTTFQKAGKTPSKRKHKTKRTPQPVVTHALTPLTQYVEDNLDSGMTVPELIAQFQEFDCDHKKLEIVASTSTVITTRCSMCYQMTTKLRPGVKKDE